MIYLMSKIGRKALFFGGLYSYDLPQSVDAKLDFWQQTVFNAARERAGRELELEFVGCEGGTQLQSVGTEVLAVDLPQEALNIIASRKVRVNFSQFKNLDNAQFASRVFHLIDQALETARKPPPSNKPVLLTLKNAPERSMGLLTLDLSQVDILGHPGRLTFKLRQARVQR